MQLSRKNCSCYRPFLDQSMGMAHSAQDRLESRHVQYSEDESNAVNPCRKC